MIGFSLQRRILGVQSVKTGGVYDGFDTLHADTPANGAAVRGWRCMENSAAAFLSKNAGFSIA